MEPNDKITISVDPEAGFCFGVVRAINALDAELDKNEDLYCIGEVVHNEEEIHRLKEKGLSIINVEELKKLKNKKVVIRAHGEPISTYEIAKKNDLEIIDATCPIVLQLQTKIRKYYDEVKDQNGQIVIYGKAKHPEIIGLNGQTENSAIILENENDIDKIDFNKPIRLFSQTTSNIDCYSRIINEVKRRKAMSEDMSAEGLKIFDTICRKVSNRARHIVDFAKKNNVVIFVSDKKSSNGNYLFDICKSANPNCYFISETSEIKKEWFDNAKNIGVSGATSTPGWLMEDVLNKINELVN